MQEISKSLRQRLGARPQPQTHPDPDLLNAYVEQALPAGEREQVILHLSECSDCREVVALSLAQRQPEKPQPELQPQTAFGSSRFWIPAFRLGAALAVLAVATTLVIKKPWQSGEQQPKQIVQAPPPIVSTASPSAAPVAALSQENGPAQPGQTRETRAAGSERGASIPEAQIVDDLRRRAPEAPRASAPQRAAAAGTAPAADAEGTRIATLAAANDSQQSAQQVAEVATEAVSVQAAQPQQPLMAEAAPVSTEAQDQYQYRNANKDYLNTNALRNDTASQNTATVSQNAGGQSTANGRAFPAVSLGAVDSHAMGVTVNPPTTTSGAGSGTPDMTFKRSQFFMSGPKKVGTEVKKGAVAVFDKAAAAGKQALGRPSLAENTLLSAPDLTQPDNQGDANTESAATAPQWRIERGTLMKSTDSTEWRPAYQQNPNLHLKVLFTKDDQIWAGGNNATIIHSWDSGVDWETIKVPTAGDITSINVDDAWQVKTSEGKTFVSKDHGKTWVPIEPDK